jgi:predicted Fe-Mo cluster-binding NifX family protein
VPVFEGDIDRPYHVIGEIKDNLRKHFAFQANPTKEKIHAEIWERARKMGADAVIHARYGPTQATAFNHGRTAISGTAITFDDNVTASR